MQDRDIICTCGCARSAHKQKINPDKQARVNGKFYIIPCLSCECQEFQGSKFATHIKRALKRQKRLEWQAKQGAWKKTPDGMAKLTFNALRKK